MNVQTRRTLTLALTIVALLVGASVKGAAQGAPAAKIDLTGSWAFTVQTAAGTGEPTVTFKQEGEKLTGHYSSMTLGEADLTGTLKGQELTFTFKPEVLAGAEVVYKGTVENNAAMKGTLDIPMIGEGTFTAIRNK